jgi:hypothetical protein
LVKKSDSLPVLRIQIRICITLGSRIRVHIKLKSDLDQQHCSKGSGSGSISPYKTKFEFSLKFCVLYGGCGQPRCPRCYSPSVHHTLWHRYHARLQGDFSYHSLISRIRVVVKPSKLLYCIFIYQAIRYELPV